MVGSVVDETDLEQGTSSDQNLDGTSSENESAPLIGRKEDHESRLSQVIKLPGRVLTSSTLGAIHGALNHTVLAELFGLLAGAVADENVAVPLRISMGIFALLLASSLGRDALVTFKNVVDRKIGALSKTGEVANTTVRSLSTLSGMIGAVLVTAEKQIGRAKAPHFFLASFCLSAIVNLVKIAMLSCVMGKDSSKCFFPLAANSTMALAVFGGLLASNPSFWPLIIGGVMALTVAGNDARPVVEGTSKAVVSFFGGLLHSRRSQEGSTVNFSDEDRDNIMQMREE